MNKKVTLIIGLPASGKSTFGKQLAQEQKSHLFDDPISLQSTVKAITESPKNSFILIHPILCSDSERSLVVQDLKMLGITTELIFFENDKEKCLLNDQNRGSLSTIDIDYFSSIYNPPKNQTLKKVN